LRQGVWRLHLQGKPAIADMKKDSPLIRKLQAGLPAAKNHNITIISAYDKNDIFIEPQAAALKLKDGDKLKNTFNIEIEAPSLAPFYVTVDDITKTLDDLPGGLPRYTKMLEKLPDKWKEGILRFYKEKGFDRLEQHRSLITLPAEMTDKMGRALIEDATNQQRVLHPDNFEPFRYQSLVARNKSFQRRILNQPLPLAMEKLEAFSRRYPQFFQALVDNIEEDLPFTNSASHQATLILTRILDLMEEACKDSALKAKHRAAMMPALDLLAHAQVTSRQGAVLRQRAAALSKKL